MQPDDRRPRHFFRHALDTIVKRIAVVAIEVAFVLSEQIRDDRMEIARQEARFQERHRPATHGVQDFRDWPVAFAVSGPCLVSQKLRMLRKDWLWQLVAGDDWLQLRRPFGTEPAVETNFEGK